MYLFVVFAVSVVQSTYGAGDVRFNTGVLKDVLQHTEAATKHVNAVDSAKEHLLANSLPDSDMDWVSTLYSDFKNSLKAELGEQLKAELKQELMNVLLKEIAAELKEDMHNGILYFKSYSTNVLETKEEIKGYLVNGIMSEARSDLENVAAAGLEPEATVINTNNTLSTNMSTSSTHIWKVPSNRTMQYSQKQNNGVIIKDNVISEGNSLETGKLSSNHLSGHNKRDTSLLRNSSPYRRVAHNDDQKIAFTTFLDHYIDHMPVKTKLIFNRILLNDGSGYDVTTGVFTVPVSGVYLFSLHFLSHRGSTELTLVLDNVHQVDTTIEHHDNAYYSVQSGNVCLIRARRGQSVWVETVHVGQGEVEGQEGYRDSTFAGVLLYADQ